MAAIDTSRPAFGSASVANRLRFSVSSLIASVAAWNDMRNTRKALNALTDRELEDIGLARGDIETVIEQGY
ncbi:MAG: DUF1127 domain-containing protein [Paracoccaceae bacterium]